MTFIASLATSTPAMRHAPNTAPREADLLTSGDVARLAGVSPQAVRAWVSAGKLAMQRTAGGMMLFRRVEVKAFLDKRAARGAA